MNIKKMSSITLSEEEFSKLKEKLESFEKWKSETENIIMPMVELQKTFGDKLTKLLKEQMNLKSSKIIHVEEEITLLKAFIGADLIKDFVLLYRASENSDTSEKFHELCDKNKNLLVIIKSENDEIIGGFVSEALEPENEFKIDQHAFLFNLTKKRRIKPNKGFCFIKYQKETGFAIDDGKFCISNNCLTEKSNFPKKSTSFYLEKDQSNIIKELEVYKVILKKDFDILDLKQKFGENVKDYLQVYNSCIENSKVIQGNARIEKLNEAIANVFRSKGITIPSLIEEDKKDELNKGFSENYQKQIEYNLLYRATENGDRASTIHQLCDNKKNILILVKTGTNKSVGAFFSESMEKDQDKIDDKGFFFRLDDGKEKIYLPTSGQINVSYNENAGPTQHGSCYFIPDNCLSQPCSFSQSCSNFTLDEGDNSIAKEVEIYHLEL